ncbi:MAG: hypothetical protein R3268_10210, partial [Acidiferrobacterales bacterium]|nr:hypothetical protein [Acidiferrobacterales bacterium]
LIPLYPLNVYYRPPSPSTDIYPLLQMPDVRGINIRHYVGGDEITVGADTWTVFPTREKGQGTNATAYQGIAYKKVTT